MTRHFLDLGNLFHNFLGELEVELGVDVGGEVAAKAAGLGAGVAAMAAEIGEVLTASARNLDEILQLCCSRIAHHLGIHTVRVENLATPGHPRIDIDAFMVM